MITLYISSTCPNCEAMLHSVTTLIKRGTMPSIEIVNIEHPSAELPVAIRSVPTLALDSMVFNGLHSLDELEQLLGGYSNAGDYHLLTSYLLANGHLNQVERLLSTHPEAYQGLLRHIGDVNSPMQVRLGVTAILEAIPKTDALEALVPELLKLSHISNDRIRADAAHCLSLSAQPIALKRLEELVADPNPEITEIATDGLNPDFEH